MKIKYLLLISIFCVLCKGEANKNVYEHKSFGLSLVKPGTWKFLDPSEFLARAADAKLKDKDMEQAIQAFADLPIVDIVKECNQVTGPRFTITVNPLNRGESALPLEIIKRVSKNAPNVFKDFRIAVEPCETQISNYKSAYMKACYVVQFYEDANQYPISYETWIVPRKQYFFMICAATPQGSENAGNEIESMIKSLKIADEPSKLNTNLYDIIKYTLAETDKYKYTIDDYLEISKPFGPWDIRPREIGQLDLGGEAANARDVQWYHFGLFIGKLKLSEDTAVPLIDKWMQNMPEIAEVIKKNGATNATELNTLAEKVKKSGHKIFAANKKFQRVDDTYFQDGKFWKYDIPKDSIYNISDKKTDINDTTFSDKDKEILELLKKQGFYGVINQNNAIVIICDGFLSYSYGYIIAPSEIDIIHLWPLFNIRQLEKIHNAPDIYFYYSS